MKALAKGRKDRYQDARAFREALQSAAGVVHEDGSVDMGTFENDVPREFAAGGHAGMASVDR